MATLLKTIFCANCQSEQKHTLTASPNGEIVATCVVCGRFLKFPSTLSIDEFKLLVKEAKSANEGQVSVETIEKSLSAFADEVVDAKNETSDITE